MKHTLKPNGRGVCFFALSGGGEAEAGCGRAVRGGRGMAGMVAERMAKLGQSGSRAGAERISCRKYSYLAKCGVGGRNSCTEYS